VQSRQSPEQFSANKFTIGWSKILWLERGGKYPRQCVYGIGLVPDGWDERNHFQNLAVEFIWWAPYTQKTVGVPAVNHAAHYLKRTVPLHCRTSDDPAHALCYRGCGTKSTMNLDRISVERLHGHSTA
jgi:hypothetical protein